MPLRSLPILTFACLAACAPTAPVPQVEVEVSEPQQRSQEEAMEEFARRYGSCDITGLDQFLGEEPDQELLDRLAMASGAIVVRTIKPGEPVSLEGNSGRLNIELDRNGTMSRFFCG